MRKGGISKERRRSPLRNKITEQWKIVGTIIALVGTEPNSNNGWEGTRPRISNTVKDLTTLNHPFRGMSTVSPLQGGAADSRSWNSGEMDLLFIQIRRTDCQTMQDSGIPVPMVGQAANH